MNASASTAGGVGAHFNLVVDGKKVGEATVSSSKTQAYSFNTKLAAGRAHDIQIQFDNDAVVNGQDRNLFLDSIAINGRTVAATDASETYHAPGVGDIAGNGAMYWGGTAQFALPASLFPAPQVTASSAPSPASPSTPAASATPTVPATTMAPVPITSTNASAGMGQDVIVVNASASTAGGVGAHFNLVVDGKKIGEATVSSSKTQAYSFNTTLAAGQAHDVQIQFDNDALVNGQDRNLFLDSIAINGRTVAATDRSETYHAPGVGDIAGSGAMYWGGTAQFTLPASFFATSSPSATSPMQAAAPTQASAPAATPGFHVAAGGNDANDGSAAHPFATLGRAAAAMEASGTRTTYVGGGTYAMISTLTLDGKASGMSFVAEAGQVPVLDGGQAHLNTLVQVNGASNVTFNGLSFINASGPALSLTGVTASTITANHFSADGTGILLTGSSRNTVSGNKLDNSAGSAIEAKDGSNGNTFDSNFIDGTGGANTQGGGFFLHGVSDNAITRNLVQNTAGMGIGIENWDTATINVGNTIAYNVVRNTNLRSEDSGAIYMLGRSHVDTKSVIANNLVDGTGAGGAAHTIGIYLDDSTSGVSVVNNIVRNIGSHGVQIHGGDDITIRNNIFDLGSGTATAVLFQAAPADTNPRNTMANDVVTGNIILSNGASSGAYSYLDGGTPNIAGNLYYDTTGRTIVTAPPVRDTRPTYGDPRFASATPGDYTLQPGSAAASIGFQPIDQSAIGLHPATAHWYPL